MRRTITVLLVFLMIISSAYATQFSTYAILGDSWSTFADYTDNPWYPAIFLNCEGYGSGNDVMFITDTWWNPLKMKLIENRSYSGSTMCYDGYGAGNDDAKEYSFVQRVKGISTLAELIIVQGGLNDSAIGVELGEYKYSDWTEDDFTSFRPALAYVLDYLKTYTDAKIIFMKCPDMNEPYSESVNVICEHYSIPVLELKDISLTGAHPNRKGMWQIRKQLMEMIILKENLYE